MKNNYRIVSFAAIAAVAALQPLEARLLSPQESIERVLNGVSRKAVAQLRNSTQLIHTEYSKTDAQPAFYVFSTAGAGGYVITTADDRLEPLLGVVDSGSFTDVPDNMKWWLNQYSEEISQFYEENPRETSPFVSTYDQYAGWNSIEPIVKALWNQGSPFNGMCPTVNGKKTATGCVATCLAQAVRARGYYGGKGKRAYSDDQLGWSVEFDFGNYRPDFANMTDKYGSNSTEIEKDAVAELMLACGVAMKSSYNTGATGALYHLQELKDYLGYSNSFTVARSGMVAAEWETLCYEILKTGVPICYGGSGTGSHAFICDGYSENGLFHFNWGWSGSSNGYFRLSALNPQNQGIGSFTGGYTLNQNIYVLLTPDEKFEFNGFRPGQVTWKTSVGLSAPAVNGTELHFNDFFYSLTSLVFDQPLELGVGLILKNRDGLTRDVFVAPGAFSPVKVNEEQHGFSVNVAGLVENGATYDAYPAYQFKNLPGYWRMQPSSTTFVDHFMITVSATGKIQAIVSPMVNPGVDAYRMEANEFYTGDNKNNFKCLIVNHSEEDFSEPLSLRLFKMDGSVDKDLATSYMIIPAGESMTLEATFGLENVPAGKYKLIISRKSLGNSSLSDNAIMDVEVKGGSRPASESPDVPSGVFEVAFWVDGKMRPMAPVSMLPGQSFSATSAVYATETLNAEYWLAFFNHGETENPIQKFHISKSDIKGDGNWRKGVDFTVSPDLTAGPYTMAFVDKNDALVSYPTDFLVGVEKDNITYCYDIATDGMIAMAFSGTLPNELEIPASVNAYDVTGVADGAFDGCRNLEQLILPATIKSVGLNAFRGASSLRHVLFSAPKAPFENSAIGFGSVNPAVAFYVPESSFAAYAPAFNYRGHLYASIREFNLPDSATVEMGSVLELKNVVVPAQKFNPEIRLEVSDPAVIEARFEGANLVITPLKGGTSSVTLISVQPGVVPAKVEVSVLTDSDKVGIVQTRVASDCTEYFDISGRRLKTPRGIFIERRGGKALLIKK